MEESIENPRQYKQKTPSTDLSSLAMLCCLLVGLSQLLLGTSGEYTLLSIPYENNPGLIDLHLLGLSPVTGLTFSFGYAQVPVYEFALKDIGKSGLLPGYRLVVHLEDSMGRTWRVLVWTRALHCFAYHAKMSKCSPSVSCEILNHIMRIFRRHSV
ncbi:hypothetical protein CAPTEDRAFT_196735 [Capitella teleta]|uniref:Uncharacterized protein n=1 Tax=Capitella teleta TaxID=283909 RepID=R7U9A4_CAPTE|nr:hypothetical protein CAPTEDRAFT_196735 [Capitella teleta]|eukprot:ELU02554.1 hypothetical protein CAPTEDRAFT_196735 [Capitella teleta]